MWISPAGGTPLNKQYRYVPPHRVGFLRRFGLKTSIRFAHIGLESGFKGTTGVYETYLSFQFQMSKKERETWEFERGLKNFFSLCSNPSEDNIISALRPSLKTGVENYIFWSEIRSGFREPGGGHTLTKDSKEYPQGEYRRRRCPFEITKLLIEHMGRGTLDLP